MPDKVSLIALKDFPFEGRQVKAGEVFTAIPDHAYLIVLHGVGKHTKKTLPDEAAKKRTYKRRNLTAE